MTVRWFNNSSLVSSAQDKAQAEDKSLFAGIVEILDQS